MLGKQLVYLVFVALNKSGKIMHAASVHVEYFILYIWKFKRCKIPPLWEKYPHCMHFSGVSCIFVNEKVMDFIDEAIK